MKFITLLIVFVLLSTKSVFGQESPKFIIFPGCEKYESKDKKKLINCYANKFDYLFTKEVKKVLRENNLTIENVHVNARIKYEINKEGEYQNLEIIGTEAEKILITQSFYNYVMNLKKKNKTIIPAKSKEGEPALLRFDIPFKIINY
ncbi:MAG: hypothetical protein KIG88_11950 [Weeksellaceae bacterium]|nr:hypothetical protein [Weeksellaceae bacterium]